MKNVGPHEIQKRFLIRGVIAFVVGPTAFWILRRHVLPHDMSAIGQTALGLGVGALAVLPALRAVFPPALSTPVLVLRCAASVLAGTCCSGCW